MKKYKEPKVLEYSDKETELKTTNKELALLVLKHLKSKTKKDMAMEAEKIVADMENLILEFKQAIKDEDTTD